MKNILLILLSIVLLASCSYQKRLNKWCARCPHKDSVSVVALYEETLRDTFITLSADSSEIKALIKCDSLGRAYISEIISLKGIKIKPQIIIKDNVITASCVIDSNRVYVSYKERYYKTSTTIQQTKAVTTNVLKWYQTMFIWMGAIGLIYFIIFFIYKLNVKKI